MKASIVLADQFEDGNRTASPAWYFSGTSPASAIVTNGLNSISGSNSLYFDSSDPFQGLTANFTPAGTGGFGGLAVGESYILTLDIRMIVANTVANGMRIGLGNSNGNPFTGDGSPLAGSTEARSHFGYQANFGTGTNTTLNVVQDAGNGNNHGFTNGNDQTTLGSEASGVALVGNQNRSILLEVKRLSTGASITGSFFSTTGNMGMPAATISVLDTSTPYFNFNQITIMSGAIVQDFTFDNVALKFVPEPSSAMITSLAVFVVLRRRRA